MFVCSYKEECFYLLVPTAEVITHASILSLFSLNMFNFCKVNVYFLLLLLLFLFWRHAVIIMLPGRGALPPHHHGHGDLLVICAACLLFV